MATERDAAIARTDLFRIQPVHGLSPIIPSPECFQISPFCVTTAAMGS